MLGLCLTIALAAAPAEWTVTNPGKTFTLTRVEKAPTTAAERVGLEARLAPLRAKTKAKTKLTEEEATLARFLARRLKAQAGPRLTLTDAKGQQRWSIDAAELPDDLGLVSPDGKSVVVLDAVPGPDVFQRSAVALLGDKGQVIRALGLEELIGKEAMALVETGKAPTGSAFGLTDTHASIMFYGVSRDLDTRTGALLPGP